MWRAVLIALFLMTGCASSHHETGVETKTTVVEHEVHEHHGHHESNDSGSTTSAEDILDDVGSGIISAFFQAIVDSIFHHDD